MAAVTQNIGTQSRTDRLAAVCRRLAPTAGLGKSEGASSSPSRGRTCVFDLATAHGRLTRFVWTRAALREVLQRNSTKLRLEETPDEQLALRLDPPFSRFSVPWATGPSIFGDDPDHYGLFRLFGEPSKMACPGWDLPSGGLRVGGSCPGADVGQTVVESTKREALARGAARAGVKLNPYGSELVRRDAAICQSCYASAGRYAALSVQLGEVVRYLWTADILKDRPQGFIDYVVQAVQRLSFAKNLKEGHSARGRPLKPVRLHSSGDFFSYDYARAWIEIARRTPEVTYWAPTRTWARTGWIDFWREASDGFPANLLVRPSAYHFGDPSPSPAKSGTGIISIQPWAGDWPASLAMGSTSLYKFENTRHLSKTPDSRAEWDCRVYAIDDAAHTCAHAERPVVKDGRFVRDARGNIEMAKGGCRVCWTRPRLTVNYTAH